MAARAIISDVHANIEALEAVLRDIDAQGITDIACLGDVVGYGPNPRECIGHMKEFRWSIRGNHEDALLFLATDFNLEAAQSIEWTRGQLNSKSQDKTANHSLWNFLGDLTDRYEEDGCLYVHGSPRMPTREYIRPADVHDSEKMEEIFSMLERICFCGHTHEPGIFNDEGRFLFPKMMNNVYKIPPGRKCVVNVGSVGQSRDRDNRACYVVYEGDTVTFRRVDYDFKTTMKKIAATKELPTHLALRLKDGR
ncbi:MAG: metallophosphoesterase [Planctomycetes bacterium]|nr:metallophosphoesterase [Planctomycetota bacterium]